MTGAYLTGHLAPVPDEITAVDLPVTGQLPPELEGRYLRNGPNPRPGEDPGHWFTGHGMIHGVRLRGGRAEWYRNRWVRTRRFTENAPYVTDKGLDLTSVQANTHVIQHAGRILALVEAGLPYEMTGELDTVGPCDFGGRLGTAMTAHPKELDGELHFFGYGFAPPYLTYHRLDEKGELVESREVRVPGPTMMHDFAVTANHVVWLDLPVVFDLAAVGSGMPYRWDDGYGARLGVMTRAGDVTWFDVDPCYVFHVGNAREDAEGRVVLEGVRYAPASFRAFWERAGGQDARRPVEAALGGVLHRWTLDPRTGRVAEERIDDRAVEFPSFNETGLGRSARYLYTVSGGSVVKYDLETGGAIEREVGGRAGEAEFVAAEGARAEDDGWLLTINGEELVVLDAADLARVASVRLPRRVPAGFHGSWIPDHA
ncbi:carotenoid oxygenase family protein [Bailinhaonella thermotolerans]|uniref:Dioxygenase n=1 Tax=Bailinhaonella thermotolerans TaxID=1070861 RepID=A0A3A4AR82_9ACTN|nr:carotenoid oxygenase family protein [Bailinhaonella thermotolerans]RJL30925.1 dioxygenase [Bailinhaonella thermotolerans]